MCYKMDEPCKHYVVWNKSDMKTMVWFLLYQTARISNFMEVESRLEVMGAWRKEIYGIIPL